MKEPIDNPYLEFATSRGDTIKVLRSAHPRARRLRLTVNSGGARVTYPQGTHPAQIFAFLRQHADWLQRKLGEFKRANAGPPRLKPGVTTLMPLRGETTRLQWRFGVYPHVKLEGDQLILSLPTPHDNRSLIAARALLHGFLHAQISRDVSRYISRYTGCLGRAPNGLRIKPLKSLWGSLDTRNWITLDLALALAPLNVLRYVVAHEMCHLRVRDHSRRFWSQVEVVYGDWETQRDWLSENGFALKAELGRLINN